MLTKRHHAMIFNNNLLTKYAMLISKNIEQSSPIISYLELQFICCPFYMVFWSRLQLHVQVQLNNLSLMNLVQQPKFLQIKKGKS